MTADHPTPAAADAVESLRRLTACRCDAAWTDRRLHAPDCVEEYREDVDVLAAELARRDAALADLTRQRDEARAERDAALFDRDEERVDAEGARRMLRRVLAEEGRMRPVIEAARALVECERLLVAQKTMLGEEYPTCQHQTDLAAAVDALHVEDGNGGEAP